MTLNAATEYSLTMKNLDRSLDAVSKQPDVARETQYYLSKIGDVK